MPLAWWATTVLRQKVVVGVALLAIFVQIVGVSAQYAHYADAVRGLTGVPIYQDRLGVDPEKIPYGNDPTRWIPELSALLVQTEGLISSQVIDRLGGDGLEVTYAPFEGRSRTVNLSDPKYRMPLDFWWVPAARSGCSPAPRRPDPAGSVRRRSGSMWCHSAGGGPGARGAGPRSMNRAGRNRGLDRDAVPQRGGVARALHREGPGRARARPASPARS